MLFKDSSIGLAYSNPLGAIWIALGIFPAAVFLGVLIWNRRLVVSLPDQEASASEIYKPKLLFLVYTLVVIFGLFLMRSLSFPFAAAGFRSARFELAVVAGLIAGLIWSALYPLLFHLFATAKSAAKASYLQRGSMLPWILIFLIGAFAEEFWRAFCLGLLQRHGYSVASSVILTSTAFVLGHPRLKLGGIIRVGSFGVVAALLFLWLNSLVVTFSFHLLGNLGALYWIRRIGARDRSN